MTFLFIFLLLLRHSFHTLSISAEGLAVLSLKTTVLTDQTNSFIFSNWNPFDLDPCRWKGITCTVLTKNSLPTVISISLPGLNLTGEIPPQLGTLPNLRRISLRGNRFFGLIPDQLFNASSLRSIFLHNNNLSGPLPPSICNIQRLQNVEFSNNALSGPIPGDLRNCKNLQRLILAGNRFAGEIPAGIWPVMESLEEVDLSRNNLSGLIPDDFGVSIKSLLNLSYNHFTGNIPESLGKLPGVVKIDLSNNNLTGEIPHFGALENQGLAAFSNNPLLCGSPLEKSCDETSPNDMNGLRKKGLKVTDIVLISVAHFILVACIGIAAVYAYWRRRKGLSNCGCPWKKTSTEQKQPSLGSFCTWFRPNDQASDVESVMEYSKEGGVGELVAINKEFGFEIDELLRASAYMLGMGIRGIVYKVVLGNGVPVVVRRLGGGEGHGSKEFAAEVQAIGRVKHPNVVRLRAYYWTQEEKLVVSDFIPNGNLATALHGRNGQPSRSLTWSVRLNIAKGVAAGLAYIHDCSARRQVHGDIRPTNILLDNDFNPVISDFGLDRLITITGSSITNSANNNLASCGIIGAATPRQHLVPTDKSNSYGAPESRIINNKQTQKWDVFSFGVVLLQLLTGRNSKVVVQTTANASDGLGLVKWVRKGLRLTRKNQAEESLLSSVIDPTLVHEVRAQKAAMALLQLALDCTEDEPETRPKMKLVSESLERIET